MPIIQGSLTLTMLANREDMGAGIKRWRIDAVDAVGRRWKHGPFSGTQAAGEAVRDTVVFHTADQDRRDLLAHIGTRGSIETFDFAPRDIDGRQGEVAILLDFADMSGEQDIKIAWWIDALSDTDFNAIRRRAGFTTTQGARIRNRAAKLLVASQVLDQTEVP